MALANSTRIVWSHPERDHELEIIQACIRHGARQGITYRLLIYLFKREEVNSEEISFVEEGTTIKIRLSFIFGEL